MKVDDEVPIPWRVVWFVDSMDWWGGGTGIRLETCVWRVSAFFPSFNFGVYDEDER